MVARPQKGRDRDDRGLSPVYVFTQLGYNLYRFGAHGWDSEYAPVGNPNRAPYSEGETIGVLLGAATVSILIATADYLIGRRRRRRGWKPLGSPSTTTPPRTAASIATSWITSTCSHAASSRRAR